MQQTPAIFKDVAKTWHQPIDLIAKYMSDIAMQYTTLLDRFKPSGF